MKKLKFLLIPLLSLVLVLGTANITFASTEGTAVALVNGVSYTSFDSAMNAANAGDTITLGGGFATWMANYNDYLTINKNITLDLNGNSITNDYSDDVILCNTTALTITNSSNTEAVISATSINYQIIHASRASTITIDGNVKFDALTNSKTIFYGDYNLTLVINNGTFLYGTFGESNSTFSATINGGSFNANPTSFINASTHHVLYSADDELYHVSVHTWNDGEVTTEATCIATGVKTYTCTTCSATKTEEVPVVAHTYGNAVFTWANDGKSATAKVTCTTENCDACLEENCIITSAIKTPATTSAKGTTTYTAKVTLGGVEYTATKDVEDIEVLNHNYEFSKIEWTDFTAKAIYVCSYDATHTEEHDCEVTNEVTTEATCVATGLRTYTATYDGHTSIKTEEIAIDTNNHNLVHHEAQAPTCTEVGWNAYDTCSRCNYSTYVEIPALNHNYEFSKIEWTEFTAKAIYVCSRDASHTEEHECVVTNEITKVANCTTKGEKTYTATYDGHTSTKTEEIAINPNNHNLVHHETQAPTCTEIGWNAYDTCSRCDYTTYVELPALNHDLIHHDAKAPTCTTIGWNAYDNCSRCNYSTYVEIPTLNHNYEFSKIEWNGFTAKAIYVCSRDASHTEEFDCVVTNEVTTEATCVATGVRTYTATYDGHTDTKTEEIAINLNNHDLVHHDAQVSTCTTIGWNAYDTCSRCEYTTYEEIPALNHNYDFSKIEWTEFTAKAIYVCSHDASHTQEYACVVTNEVTTIATCTTKGEKTYTATYDGHTSTKTEEIAINPNNHDIISHEAKAPTCTKVGWNAYDTCKREGCTYSTYVEIPALNHNYGEAIFTWSQDDKTCTAKVVCANDETHILSSDCVVTSSVKVPATCEAKGTTTYTAKITLNEIEYTDTKDVEDISALNHNYGDVIYTWAEDGKTCSAKLVCSHDANHILEGNCEISSAVQSEATCIAKGVTTYTAMITLNGTKYSATKDIADIAINKNNHSLVSHKAKSATCLEAGWSAYNTCSRCDYTTYAEIPALNHNYQFSKIEWNEFEATTIYVCSNDATHTEKHECAISSEITKVANCTTKGEKTYTATYDGHTSTKTEEIAINPDNHDLVHHDAKAPTCTEIGWSAYDTCSRCDYSTYEEIKALGHDYGEAIFTWSNDGKTATAKVICSRDANHILEGTCTITSTVKVQPTKEAKGTTTYTAKVTLGGTEYTATMDVDDIAKLSEEEKPVEPSSGCGSTLGSSTLILVLVATLGFGIKKKEN